MARTKVDISLINPVTTPIQIPDGNVTVPGLCFKDDTDSGLYRLGTNHIGLTVGGAGDALDIDAQGCVTQYYQPSFLATCAGNILNVTGNAYAYTVAFDAERFDQNADYNTGTYTFTAPVTGRYLLTAAVGFENIPAASLDRRIIIRTSNRDYSNASSFNQVQSYIGINLAVLADMDANDTVYVVAYFNGAGANTIDILGGDAFNSFSGSLIN